MQRRVAALGQRRRLPPRTNDAQAVVDQDQEVAAATRKQGFEGGRGAGTRHAGRGANA